jgi:hypothetical protein
MLSKKTIDEMLDTYLNEKSIDEKTKKKIMGELHSKVKKQQDKKKDKEEKLRKKQRKKARISHGTSCPRIMNTTGEMAIEF